MARRISLTLKKLGTHVHNHVYSEKGDIRGLISLTPARYISGSGYQFNRVYEFPFWKSEVTCVCDEARELDDNRLDYALEGLKEVVFPAVVEESSRSKNRSDVLVRRAIIGKDILKD